MIRGSHRPGGRSGFPVGERGQRCARLGRGPCSTRRSSSGGGQVAADALDAAGDNADAGWHNWACMIAEQAAQLAAKALPHGVGRAIAPGGRTCCACLRPRPPRRAWRSSEKVHGAALRLVRHHQPTRHPDALPGGTPHRRYRREDAEEALADARVIVAAVDETRAALGTAAGEEGPR
ncbi:MAG: HEPN domain-containing protein [Actinomycetota bacterium]|nr:HEPN domain-containing protein [Actinomycetota bacterium]